MGEGRRLLPCLKGRSKKEKGERGWEKVEEGEKIMQKGEEVEKKRE
jgi:hypothetical protein